MPTKDEKIEMRCCAELKHELHRLRRLTGSRSLSATARLLLEETVTSKSTSLSATVIPAMRDLTLHLDRLASALQRLLLSQSCLERNEDIHRVLAQIESLSHRAKDFLPPKRCPRYRSHPE
jgi:hypothetical protein